LDQPPQWLIRAVQLLKDLENLDPNGDVLSVLSSNSSIYGPGYYLGKGLERLGRPFWKATAKAIVIKRISSYIYLISLWKTAFDSNDPFGSDFLRNILKRRIEHYESVSHLFACQERYHLNAMALIQRKVWRSDDRLWRTLFEKRLENFTNSQPPHVIYFDYNHFLLLPWVVFN